MAVNNKQVTGWVGWVYFAGLLMMVAGVFQGIAGLTALLKNDFYVVTERALLAFNVTTWGWVHMLLGVILLAAGAAVINGRTWGRIIAIILATLSAMANFLFISAYPVWSIMVIVIDILIIYALVVHGDEAAE